MPPTSEQQQLRNYYDKDDGDGDGEDKRLRAAANYNHTSLLIQDADESIS